MSPTFPNAAIIPPGPGAVGASTTTPPSRPAANQPPANGPSFSDVLAQSTTTGAGGVGAGQAPQFSRHALDRVQRRGIRLDPPTLARLGDGISRAGGKGARNTVVFVDNNAFVANVPSNTVITAVGSEHMREHVFTNIDSAVIA